MKVLLFLVLSHFLFSSYSLGTGDSCTITDPASDPCPALHSCIDGFCKHKDIWPPTKQELIGSILMVIVGGIANSTGAGGSFLLIPILMLLFNYSTNGAIRVVYSLIFGGMIGAYLGNVRQREKNTGLPLIQYDLGLVCLPMLLFGASIGVLMNEFLPSITTLVALVIILLKTVVSMFRKVKMAWHEERDERNMRLLSIQPEMDPPNDENKDSYTMVVPGMSNSDEGTYAIPSFKQRVIDLTVESQVDPSPDFKSSLKPIIDKERRLFPWERYFEYLLLLGAMITISLIRGTDQVKSIIGLEYCSTQYWLAYFAIAPVALIFSFRAYWVCKAEYELKLKAGYNFNDRFRLVPEKIPSFMFISFVNGVLGSFIGIGGGLLLVPAMIGWGLNSLSAAATSGFLIIFTSFLSLYLVFLTGEVSNGEWVYFFIVALLGSLVIGNGLRWLVEKYRRPSILMIGMLMLVIAGLIILPAYGVVKAIDDPDSLYTFGSFCR